MLRIYHAKLLRDIETSTIISFYPIVLNIVQWMSYIISIIKNERVHGSIEPVSESPQFNTISRKGLPKDKLTVKTSKI